MLSGVWWLSGDRHILIYRVGQRCDSCGRRHHKLTVNRLPDVEKLDMWAEGVVLRHPVPDEPEIDGKDVKKKVWRAGVRKVKRMMRSAIEAEVVRTVNHWLAYEPGRKLESLAPWWFAWIARTSKDSIIRTHKSKDYPSERVDLLSSPFSAQPVCGLFYTQCQGEPVILPDSKEADAMIVRFNGRRAV